MAIHHTDSSGTIEIHWEQIPFEAAKAAPSVVKTTRKLRHMLRFVFRSGEVETTMRRAPPKTLGRDNPRFASLITGWLTEKDVLEFDRVWQIEMEKFKLEIAIRNKREAE